MFIPSGGGRRRVAPRLNAARTIYADHSARSRAATFVTSSPLQLRPTYAIEGSEKRSESVRLSHTKEHLSLDSHVIRVLVKRPNNWGSIVPIGTLGSHHSTWQGSIRSVLASHVTSQRGGGDEPLGQNAAGDAIVGPRV